ncbi:MAG: tyrosine-type recombinase/integrase [Parachlamydia sp.]|jgi:integrase|nr:tyrosine-type recombinase/integrase [Parachlamydia sp.]
METSRLEAIEENLKRHKFSERVINIVANAEERRRIDDSRWRRFVKWCEEGGIDPFIPSSLNLANFCAEISVELAAATVTQYRSTVENVWELTSNAVIETDVIAKKINAAMKYLKPTRAKYDSTYDIGPILDFIRRLPEDSEDDARLRLILLLRVQLLRRCADCEYIIHSSIDLEACTFRQSRRKSQKDRPQVTEPIPFEENKEMPELCLRRAFKNYLEFTKQKRKNQKALFIALNQDRPIVKKTIGKLCLNAMTTAGINTEIFKSHSLRMAAANALLDSGMTIEEVMKLGDWQSSEVFMKFYHRARITGASASLSLLAKEYRRKSGRTRGRGQR